MYELREHVDTQEKVDLLLPTRHDMPPKDFVRNDRLKHALFHLHAEIIFFEVCSLSFARSTGTTQSQRDFLWVWMPRFDLLCGVTVQVRSIRVPCFCSFLLMMGRSEDVDLWYRSGEELMAFRFAVLAAFDPSPFEQ